MGLAGAFLSGGPPEGFLFGVERWDPFTYLGVTAALFVMTLDASYLPARRAGRVAPMEVLREE